MGEIEITNKFTCIEVKADQAERLVNAFEQNGPNGINISVAEPRRNDRGRGQGRSSRYKDRNDRNDRYTRDNRRRDSRSEGRGRRDDSRGRTSSRSNSSNSAKPWRRRAQD